MILSIITINRNDAAGLEKTMQSVLSQTRTDFEYVVVDGASTDDSVAVIRRLAPAFGDRLKWVSEPDKGIYNAMNKGIGMATGEYVHFLNSGDRLVSTDVLEKTYCALDTEARPPILFGNVINVFPDGHTCRNGFSTGVRITFIHFFQATIPHQAAYIRRSLYDRYGLYDESLKIVSDWKWFMSVIALKGEAVAYVDIDIVFYDMTGISQDVLSREQERTQVLSALLPESILADYRNWSAERAKIRRWERLMRHPWSLRPVWFLERCLFKWEKWTTPREKGQ